jgi:hypothetical protein
VVDAVLRGQRASSADLVDDSGLRVECHRFAVADRCLTLGEAVFISLVRLPPLAP